MLIGRLILYLHTFVGEGWRVKHHIVFGVFTFLKRIDSFVRMVINELRICNSLLLVRTVFEEEHLFSGREISILEVLSYNCVVDVIGLIQSIELTFLTNFVEIHFLVVVVVLFVLEGY